MKKIKCILVAIATLGIIGGALAYKAKRFGSDAYCYTTTIAPGAKCCFGIANAQMLGESASRLKYATTFNANFCGNCVPCSNVAASIGM